MKEEKNEGATIEVESRDWDRRKEEESRDIWDHCKFHRHVRRCHTFLLTWLLPAHLLVLLPLSWSHSLPLLPAHVPPTLRQEHADKGMYGLVSPVFPLSHFIISVIHKEYACGLAFVCMFERMSGSLCRWRARVFLCVSVPEKGRPQGVVLHFHSVINSPFAPTVFARMGQDGRRAVEGFGGEEEKLE